MDHWLASSSAAGAIGRRIHVALKNHAVGRILAEYPADVTGSMHWDRGPAQGSQVAGRALPAAAALLLRNVGAGS